MTASFTANEIELLRAVHLAAQDLRGQIECMDYDDDLEECMSQDEMEQLAQMDVDLANYTKLLAKNGVSINGPFELPLLPADYWVGNT